jgi:hypothetical protein
MVAMIKRKQAYASLNHGSATLGGTRINDWFDDPDGFLAALAASSYVAPGKPEESGIFSLFSAEGPMFGVFSADERQLWTDWIRSLGPRAQPPTAAMAGQADGTVPTPGSNSDLAKRMAVLLDVLRPSLATVFAERSQLVGPDPFRPGALISQTPSWWLQQSTPALMRAIVQEENKLVVASDAASPLVAMLAGASGAIAAALQAPIPAAGGICGDQIVRHWIAGGCPLPPDLPRLRMSTSMHADTLNGLPLSYLRGMGAVH